MKFIFLLILLTYLTIVLNVFFEDQVFTSISIITATVAVVRGLYVLEEETRKRNL